MFPIIRRVSLCIWCPDAPHPSLNSHKLILITRNLIDNQDKKCNEFRDQTTSSSSCILFIWPVSLKINSTLGVAMRANSFTDSGRETKCSSTGRSSRLSKVGDLW